MIGRTNNPFKEAYSAIEYVGKLGFDYVEITLDSFPDLDKINTPKLNKILKKYNMKATAHYPWVFQAYFKSSTLNQAILKQFEGLMKNLKKIKTKYVVIHPPKLGPFERPLIKDSELFAHFRKMAQIAKKNNIKLAIENLPWLNNINEIKKYLKIPNLYFVLDVGHSNVKKSKSNFEGLLKNFHKKTIAFHISDNKGEDDHLMPGKGNTNWKKFFQLVKKYKLQNKPMTIEIGNYPKKDVIKTKKLIEKNIK
ncbi:sugar phosphate isomerase/epimerase family protein [Nanoarchaeota archaeon]